MRGDPGAAATFGLKEDAVIPTRVFSLFVSTDFDAQTEEQARRFEEKILAEDQSVLEGYRSKAMRLELGTNSTRVQIG